MNNSTVEIRYCSLEEIQPYENKPRKKDNAVDAVMESIQAFGFLVPIVIDAEGVIVAGHTRYKAAQRLGLEKVPCISAADLTDEQVQAFRLVDNKTAELAVWDLPLMEAELEEIGDSIDMGEFGFDLGISDVFEGFDSSKEYDLDEFGDDEFDYECPECGFKFNEYK